jgi:predicted glycoside hydrolase/deacetylase ChbG (UPF0249 family)
MSCPTFRNTSRGLLIVNADDWGLDARSTDAALHCFRARAITSATGMVWMADSERAAAIARKEHFPIGLHLNLIEPFSDPNAPVSVAARQRAVGERFAAAGSRGLLYNPRWTRAVERCIADQLERFEELYGGPPAHVDGHRHLHLSLNSVFARPLARVKRLRPSFTFLPPESPAHKRVARAALNALIRRRYSTARYLFNLRALHPALGGRLMDEKLALAARHPVEVMVHPAKEDELRVLTDGGWAARIAEHRLGTYAEL